MNFEIILLAKILVMPGGHGTQKPELFQALTWPKTLQTRLAIIIDWIHSAWVIRVTGNQLN